MQIVMNYRSIPDVLQARIVEFYGIKGLIEIVVLCGFCGLIRMVITSFKVQLTSCSTDR